jgi:hypothetical protein
MPSQPPYDLGNDKHVFVDLSLIEADRGHDSPRSPLSGGLSLSVHKPRLDPRPFLHMDMPWEGALAGGGSVFEEDGFYRLYYQCRLPRAGSDSWAVACAESDNGSEWVKPNLGIVEFGGSLSNNLVFDASVAGRSLRSVSVFRDYIAETARRFKMVYRAPYRDGSAMFVAVSADGLRWDPCEGPALSGIVNGDTTFAGFDTNRGKYFAYLDVMTEGRRTVTLTESHRFENWPAPVSVIGTNPGGDADGSGVTTGYARWPGADAHLMFQDDRPGGTGPRVTRMLTSRDGLSWRAQLGDPLNDTDASGAATGLCAAGLVSLQSGEVSLLITPARRTPHDLTSPATARPSQSNGAYYALTWRQDGLMSLEAETIGQCRTRPFTFDGESLRINTSTKAGGALRFELLDASGHEGAKARAVQGRGLADCDPIAGDYLDRMVTWGGQSDVSAWSGRPVQLGISIRGARLYSLRFHSEVRSVTDGVVAWD